MAFGHRKAKMRPGNCKISGLTAYFWAVDPKLQNTEQPKQIQPRYRKLHELPGDYEMQKDIIYIV